MYSHSDLRISAELTKATGLLILPTYLEADRACNPESYEKAPWSNTGHFGTTKYALQYMKSAQVI